MARSNLALMGSMHRAINLIIALATCCFGLWGFVYFYFIASNGWMAMATGVVGVAGLYWLWEST